MGDPDPVSAAQATACLSEEEQIQQSEALAMRTREWIGRRLQAAKIPDDQIEAFEQALNTPLTFIRHDQAETLKRNIAYALSKKDAIAQEWGNAHFSYDRAMRYLKDHPVPDNFQIPELRVQFQPKSWLESQVDAVKAMAEADKAKEVAAHQADIAKGRERTRPAPSKPSGSYTEIEYLSGPQQGTRMRIYPQHGEGPSTQPLTHALSTDNKVEIALGLITAGLSAFGAWSALRDAKQETPDGKNQWRPSQLGLGLIEAAFAVGVLYCTHQAYQRAR